MIFGRHGAGPRQSGGKAAFLCLFAASLLMAQPVILCQQEQAGSAARAGEAIASPEAPTEALRPVLDRVKAATAAINASRWKAPGDVRAAMQKNIDSIQQDIGVTLPSLMDQARTPPVSLASCFAVYRNIDALYDVLLRLSETAALAAPQGEAIALRANLANMESARRELGDAIVRIASSQEQEIANLRAAAAAQAAAAQAAAQAAAARAALPAKTVVEDGPAPSAKSKKKKKQQAPPLPPAAVTPNTSN